MRHGERRARAATVRTWTTAILAVAAAFVATLGPWPGRDERPAEAVAQDAPRQELVLEATVSSGGPALQPLEIRVAADGVVTARLLAWDRSLRHEIALTLSDTERADLRRRVEACRFFDEWGDGRPHPHAVTWDVALTLDGRERRRKVVEQDEFRGVEAFLWRVMRQAEVSLELREGTAWRLADAIRNPEHQGVLHLQDLVPDLANCLATSPKDSPVWEAAGLLIEILPSADAWGARVAEIVPRLAGARRGSVLVRWAEDCSKPGREGHAAALAPIAVAYVRDGWKDWPSVDTRDIGDRNAANERRGRLRALLGFALRTRAAGALDLAEKMVRGISPAGERFVPPDLAHVRAAAIPMTLRLLADDDAFVRESAVWMATVLIETARPLASDRQRRGAPSVTEEERAALATGLAAELIPALERRMQAAEEVLETRTVARNALLRWAGRDPVAESRARGAELERRRADKAARRRDAEAERRKADVAANTPPRGDLAIEGRVLGSGDTPLPEMTVAALRADGPPEQPSRMHGTARCTADGSFRIEGLVAGEFRLVALRGDRWGWREFAGNLSARDGVAAGARDVVLRFPGAMIRGRVVREGGAPLAAVNVRVLLRDAPSTLPNDGLVHDAWAETDPDGRFLLLGLLAGTWDATIAGRPFLRGATGLEPGPEVRTIEVVAGGTVSGRVVDAAGDPLPGAVVAVRLGAAYFEGFRATTGDDGSFTISGLDPAHRYVVGAGISDGRPPESRSVTVEAVEVGTVGLVLRIDTGPEIRGRVEFPPGRRGTSHREIVRLVRVTGGDPLERSFRTTTFRWRIAPPGTWRVVALVRTLDAQGADVDEWREVGTIATGDAEGTFAVPR